MQNTNPYLKFHQTTDPTLLLQQVALGMEALLEKNLTPVSLVEAVTFLAETHGLSCHLLSWLTLGSEEMSVEDQSQEVGALCCIVLCALGRSPEGEDVRKAATDILLNEEEPFRAGLLHFYASRGNYKIDPRQFQQWQYTSESSLFILPEIWSETYQDGEWKPNLPLRPILSGKPPTRPAAQHPFEGGIQTAPPSASQLTRSQSAALHSMNEFLRLAESDPAPLAGISPRFHPLIVGPSGAGKTFLIRELARVNARPFFQLDIGSWNLSGISGHVSSETRLANFVREAEKGIVFIDELDKLNGRTEWQRCVQQEAFALLDGRMEPFPSWDTFLNEKFRRSFFIVGAGTWQGLQPSAVRLSAYAEPPFGPIETTPPKINLHGQTEIAEELLYRFNRELIVLEAMAPEEISQRIAAICSGVEVAVPGPARMDQLTAEAIGSKVQHRWLESMVTRALVYQRRERRE